MSTDRPIKAEIPDDFEDLPLPISTEPDEVETFFATESRINWAFPPGRNPTARSIEDLLEACLNGEVEKVRHTLYMRSLPQSSISFDLNQRFPGGDTILMRVCQRPCDSRHLFDDIIHLLIEHKANVNARNEKGDTAMTIAIQNAGLQNGGILCGDQVCKVKKLIGFGAAVNTPNHVGITPLMMACMQNRSFIVYSLLDYGADTGAKTADGKTAFDYALGKYKCERALQEKAKQVAEKFDEALNMVIRKENFEILTIVNADGIKTTNVFFPLHCYSLCESNKFQVVFNLDEEPKKPTTDAIPVLVIGKARFGGTDQVRVRFWGPTPVQEIKFNGVKQAAVTDGGGFLFSFWPIRRGTNHVAIECKPNCVQSQQKLIIGAVMVRVVSKNEVGAAQSGK